MKKQDIKDNIEKFLVEVKFNSSDRIILSGDKSIKGDTYKIKDVIKELGGKWKPLNGEWKFSSKVKAELVVEIATQKIELIAEENHKKQMAEMMAEIVEIVDEYAMNTEQESKFKAIIQTRRKGRLRNSTFRYLTSSFLESISAQRDPDAVRKEDEEKAVREFVLAERKRELEEAKSVIEKARQKKEELRIIKEAEIIKKVQHFKELVDAEPSTLIILINRALDLVHFSKRKGFMLASDKQKFRNIQSEIGQVIEKLEEKNLSNTAMLEFYYHNDNRMDRITVDHLLLSDIVTTKVIA